MARFLIIIIRIIVIVIVIIRRIRLAAMGPRGCHFFRKRPRGEGACLSNHDVERNTSVGFRREEDASDII
jgi:hypothetical protein